MLPGRELQKIECHWVHLGSWKGDEGSQDPRMASQGIGHHRVLACPKKEMGVTGFFDVGPS